MNNLNSTDIDNRDDNISRNNLLGHKREQDNRETEEENRNNLELNANNQNASSVLNQNVERDSNINSQDEINNHTVTPCFDIIVEDFVESGSLDDEDDLDGDSNAEM